jgi:hypothetical protein
LRKAIKASEIIIHRFSLIEEAIGELVVNIGQIVGVVLAEFALADLSPGMDEGDAKAKEHAGKAHFADGEFLFGRKSFREEETKSKKVALSWHST